MNTGNGSAIAVALLVGMILPLQALINARLGLLTQGSLFASAVSFLVGTVVLVAALIAMRTPMPSSLQLITDVPWWAWLGGVLGAVFVLSSTVLVPTLGAARLVCLIVLGQIVGSLLLDHFGVLHAAKPIEMTRLVGAALVVAGVMLVVKP